MNDAAYEAALQHEFHRKIKELVGDFGWRLVFQEVEEVRQELAREEAEKNRKFKELLAAYRHKRANREIKVIDNSGIEGAL